MLKLLKNERERKMKSYNISFEPKKRTSMILEEIPNNIVFANNKSSAKELGQAIVRDIYNGDDDMVGQYKYIIEEENL